MLRSLVLALLLSSGSLLSGQYYAIGGGLGISGFEGTFDLSVNYSISEKFAPGVSFHYGLAFKHEVVTKTAMELRAAWHFLGRANNAPRGLFLAPVLEIGRLHDPLVSHGSLLFRLGAEIGLRAPMNGAYQNIYFDASLGATTGSVPKNVYINDVGESVLLTSSANGSAASGRIYFRMGIGFMF